MKNMVQLSIRRQEGGRWLLEFPVEAPEPPPDD